MAEMSIIAVEPGSGALREVMRLHKSAKATLGFLPDQGFVDRAERGTLLAVVDDGRVLGYVIFDLTSARVKLRYLCVARTARRRGVARLLIDELKRKYPDRHGIVLDCRRDYGLSAMWQALGFRAQGERRGRSDKGLPLTLWELDFGHPTLLTEAPVVGDLVCIDQMVLEDLVTGRPAGLQSRRLREDWVEEMAELCVTDEIFRESHATEEDELRQRLMGAAHGYRNLSRPHAPWQQHVARIAEIAEGAGVGDHRHLAQAVEGGAVYFVTRDKRLLRAAEGVQAEFGIVVASPAGLVDRLDRQRAEDRYQPVVLEGTTLIEERLPAVELDAFVSALLNHAEGERGHVLKETARKAYTNPQAAEVMVIKDLDGQILGGVVRAVDEGRLVIDALRVRRGGPLTDAVARQLVFLQRKLAADRRLSEVTVMDAAPSPAVRRVLPSEFFEADEGTWRCTVRVGIFRPPEVFSGDADPHEVAAFERRCWPAKVESGLPTFMVSIEPSFAERLLDAELAGATLFPRPARLGLSREQVYYRSPTWKNALHGPARVLWYVKKAPGHPVGHVRAVSHLVDVALDRPRTLHKRYKRLGVWSQKQVEETGRRTGEAMALHVMDTERFDRPLSLPRVRELYASADETFHAPQGPVRVSERMFCLLYRESSAYA
jgi:ribosomal protein S18 acetylase RimI-like enzyme/predicted transcriptional regulator